MIIRRRTYIKQFTGKYGYFMRNVDAYDGEEYTANSSSGSLEYKTNIYTRCMQKETPIGNFPTNYRNTQGVINSNTTNDDGYYRYSYLAVGYTDGATIIVATAQNLYISNSGGASWTLVCKWWQDGNYLWKLFNPIVYMDSSNYYIIYATYGGYSGSQIQLKKFVRSRSNTTSSTSTIQTIYSSAQNSYNEEVINMDSTFYANKVSPKGQFMFIYQKTNSGDYATYRWEVFDIPRGTYAYYTLYNQDSSYSQWQYTGQWINNGTTYGQFLLQISNTVYGNNYHYEYYHCLITSSAFSNGSTLSGTAYNSISSSTSKFGKMFSDNLIYDSGNYGPYWPQFLVASCDQTYKNKIFVMVMRLYVDNYKFYVCNADFSNPVEISGVDKSTIEHTINPDGYKSHSCGVYVTPDGQYGVMLRNYGAAVFNLASNSYMQAFQYLNNDDDKALNYMSTYTSFMLPSKTI